MYFKNFPHKRYRITTDFINKHIDKSELTKFRKAISDQWITKIKESSSEAYKKIVDENISIQEYHLVSDYLDHSKIWTKS